MTPRSSRLLVSLIAVFASLPTFAGCGGGDAPSDETGSGGNASGLGTGGDPSGGSTGGSNTGGGLGDVTGGSSAGGSLTGGTGGNGSGGMGNSAAVPSQGCGKSDGVMTLTAGGSSVVDGLSTSTRLSIMSGGMTRDFIVDIPENYDPNESYRLIFSWHQAFGSANGNAIGQVPANAGPNFNAENYAYFGLRRESANNDQPAIFVAPQGIGDYPWDYNRDVVLFDDLLDRVSENLCIDESRVFTTGFSYGAMMSHALSLGRASKLRGAVTMAPANFNFTQPTNETESVAYFGITGMTDGLCSWVDNEEQKRGGKFCVLTHAEDNGCTIPGEIQTAPGGSNDHICYEFEGCDEGYPVKVCTFDGAHTPTSVSDGMSGDDGLDAFIPPLAWEFISQL